MTKRFVGWSALALLLAGGVLGVACGSSGGSGGGTGGAAGEGPDDSGGGASATGGKSSSGGGADGGAGGGDEEKYFGGHWIGHDGTMYVADTDNCVVRKVDPEGVITTVAGTPGDCGDDGDGGPATEARLNYPADVALGPNGDLYIADSSNFRVRRVDAKTGIISVFAGTGEPGDSGDDGPAEEARLGTPAGVVVDREGNVFISDLMMQRVRKVDASSGVITTVAGGGTEDPSTDESPATAVHLDGPAGLAADGTSLYIGTLTRALKVDLEEGTLVLLAGTGDVGSEGDGGPAQEAELYAVAGLALDTAGHLYILDLANHALRKVDAETGVLTTIAGTLGTEGDSGDGGSATSATFNWPGKLALDRYGHMYVADIYNHRVRKVNTETGVVTTVVGTGTEGFIGDGGSARDAQLAYPFDVMRYWD